MSKTDWYGGYGYVSSKDNYEDVISKKEMMQQRFIQMCAVKSSDGNNKKATLLSDNTKGEFVKKVKDKNDGNEKVIKSLKKEIGEHKKTILRVKKEHEKTKKLRFQCIKEIEIKEIEIEDWKSKYEKLMKEIEMEKEKSRSIQKELDKYLNSNDKKEIHKLRSENQKLNQKVLSLTSGLRAANKQIQNFQLIRTGEVESKIIEKHKQRFIEKDNEIENLKSKLISATSVINVLNSKILHKRKPQMIKKSRKYKDEIKLKRIVSESNITNHIAFGFLSLNKEAEIIFVDLQGRCYKISQIHDIERMKKYIGMPVRVIKKEDFVIVDYIYYNITKGSKVKALNNKTFKVRKQAEYSHVVKDEFKGKKIMVICSENKDKYLTALSKAGADVAWFDGFSDNESRIGDIAPSCDVVIVCTSHIPHSVSYKINSLVDYQENKTKYQMLEKDNVVNIICRVRYALENM